MTALNDELRLLAERVEAATGPDRELDRLIQLAIRKPVPSDRWTGRDAIPPQKPRHFTASLDAAMQLVPEGWAAGFEENARCDEPGKSYAWTWPLESDYDPDWQLGQEGQQSNPDALKGYAATPALALTAAALRARASIEGGK